MKNILAARTYLHVCEVHGEWRAQKNPKRWRRKNKSLLKWSVWTVRSPFSSIRWKCQWRPHRQYECSKISPFSPMSAFRRRCDISEFQFSRIRFNSIRSLDILDLPDGNFSKYRIEINFNSIAMKTIEIYISLRLVGDGCTTMSICSTTIMS